MFGSVTSLQVATACCAMPPVALLLAAPGALSDSAVGVLAFEFAPDWGVGVVAAGLQAAMKITPANARLGRNRFFIRSVLFFCSIVEHTNARLLYGGQPKREASVPSARMSS
jgi:hypothetical protein